MGDKKKLYQRSSLIFFSLGVVALGLQLVGLLLPFWVEDDWQSIGLPGKMTPPYHVFQGLWSDYECEELYLEKYEEDKLRLSYRNCSIQFHSLEEEKDSPVPSLERLRVLEVMSLGFGLISVLSVIGIYVTAKRRNCKRVTSQILFAAFSLAAGLCAVMGVMVVAGSAEPSKLSWGLVFPTIAGFFWLGNGAFSFVICRYDPTFGTPENPVVPILENGDN